MSRRIAIHQPSYFPWLGYLKKIHKSDTFVILDRVQLSDSNFQHRNLFYTNGGKKYLTIGIEKKNYLKKEIRDIKIADNGWNRKHLNFLKENYRKHNYFHEIFPEIEWIFLKKYDFLLDLLIDTMNLSVHFFGLKNKFLLQSQLPDLGKIHKEKLILAILNDLGASKYVSGEGIFNYADKEDFFKNNIDIEIIRHSHYKYQQYNICGEFIAGLSCLDFLFNCGIEKAKVYFENED